MMVCSQKSSFPVDQIDPAALAAPGLIIFGITAIVVNLSSANILIPATGLLVVLTLCGGLGQLLVAALDWSRKNVFSATVFASYGLFCLSLVPLMILPRAGQMGPQSQTLAAYLALWGLFSIVLFGAFSKKSRALRLMFALLALFLLLSATDAVVQSSAVQAAAVYAGILFGIDAIVVGLSRKRCSKGEEDRKCPLTAEEEA